MPRDNDYLLPLNQTGMWASFETEGISNSTQTQAENINFYPNLSYGNAPIMYADDNSFLITNYLTREPYSMPWDPAAQLNSTRNMTIPEEEPSFDPRDGMYLSEDSFAAAGPLYYDSPMQSLERNAIVFHGTAPYPTLPYTTKS